MTTAQNTELLAELKRDIAVSERAPSTGTAYLFWFFMGALGAHRFYLRRNKSANTMLAMWFIGVVLAFVGLAIVSLGLFALVGVWSLIDVFRIPGFVRVRREEIRREIVGGGK